MSRKQTAFGVWRSFGSSLAVTHSVLHSSCVDGSYNCRRRTTSVAGASSPGGGTGGRQHAVFYCPSPASCLPPSLPPPLLAFQSSKSDEGRVRLRLLFSVRGGSSPASLVVPFGPPATAATVLPKEISAAGVGWEMGSHDRAAVAFSPSTRLSSLRSVLGGHHSSVLTQDGRSVCWRVRPSQRVAFLTPLEALF